MSHLTSIMAGLSIIKDTYSDCTIEIQGEKPVHAHRIVLHLHSPVLVALVEEKAQDGEEAGVKLDLTEDDPDAFRAMLHFFYHGDYEAPPTTSPLAFHVDVVKIAEKYETSALKTFAVDSFEDILISETWNADEMVNAATKLEQIIATASEAATSRSRIIEALSKRAFGLFETAVFKDFIRANPGWVVHLLKTYELAGHSTENFKDEVYVGEGHKLGKGGSIGTDFVYGIGGCRPPSKAWLKKFPPS